jgi:RNA recognition motif-containing protein
MSESDARERSRSRDREEEQRGGGVDEPKKDEIKHECKLFIGNLSYEVIKRWI